MFSTALEREKNQNSRLKAALQHLRQEGEHATRTALKGLAASGTAALVSYAEHAYPDSLGQGILGIDLSLAAGVVLTVVGAMELAGDERTNEIVESAGIGALCAFAAKTGAQKGKDAAEQAKAA